MRLLTADEKKLTRRVYNLAGLSPRTDDMAILIARRIPGFVCSYKPDYRQMLMNGWPKSVTEGSNKDWGWSFQQSLPQFVDKVLAGMRAETKRPS